MGTSIAPNHAESRDGGLVNKNPNVLSREDAVRQIRAEYLEMPGLCLTCAQAQRLFGLDPLTCSSLLDKGQIPLPPVQRFIRAAL